MDLKKLKKAENFIDIIIAVSMIVLIVFLLIIGYQSKKHESQNQTINIIKQFAKGKKIACYFSNAEILNFCETESCLKQLNNITIFDKKHFTFAQEKNSKNLILKDKKTNKFLAKIDYWTISSNCKILKK